MIFPSPPPSLWIEKNKAEKIRRERADKAVIWIFLTAWLVFFLALFLRNFKL